MRLSLISKPRNKKLKTFYKKSRIFKVKQRRSLFKSRKSMLKLKNLSLMRPRKIRLLPLFIRKL